MCQDSTNITQKLDSYIWQKPDCVLYVFGIIHIMQPYLHTRIRGEIQIVSGVEITKFSDPSDKCQKMVPAWRLFHLSTGIFFYLSDTVFTIPGEGDNL